MDGQIWLTTATEDGHDYFAICVDADTGEILHNKKLFHSDKPEPLGNNVNCYASPSPAIEPGRVYVHFGSYGTACLDTATGETLWSRDDLPCRHYRGPSSSVVLFENLRDPHVRRRRPAIRRRARQADRRHRLEDRPRRRVERPERHRRSTRSTPSAIRDGDHRKAHSTPLIVTAADGRRKCSAAARRRLSPTTRAPATRSGAFEYDDFSVAPRPLYQRWHRLPRHRPHAPRAVGHPHRRHRRPHRNRQRRCGD